MACSAQYCHLALQDLSSSDLYLALNACMHGAGGAGHGGGGGGGLEEVGGGAESIFDDVSGEFAALAERGAREVAGVMGQEVAAVAGCYHTLGQVCMAIYVDVVTYVCDVCM